VVEARNEHFPRGVLEGPPQPGTAHGATGDQGVHQVLTERYRSPHGARTSSSAIAPAIGKPVSSVTSPTARPGCIQKPPPAIESDREIERPKNETERVQVSQQTAAHRIGCLAHFITQVLVTTAPVHGSLAATSVDRHREEPVTNDGEANVECLGYPFLKQMTAQPDRAVIQIINAQS
jgi:hypothetical protein